MALSAHTWSIWHATANLHWPTGFFLDGVLYNVIFQQPSASIKPLSQPLSKDNKSKFGVSCKIKLGPIWIQNYFLTQ